MKKIFTAIHVDDEPLALDLFREFTSKIAGVQLVKSFTSVQEVISYLDNYEVDILFSDIEMPNHDGFWLADQASRYENLSIVFVTSHTEYALKAFEACALDFLVKPLQMDKLQQVVERVKKKLNAKQLKEQIKELFSHYITNNSYPQRVFVQTIGKMHVVALTEVMYFSAIDAYTKVHFVSKEELISSKILKTYVDALQNHPDFVRIHRAFLVNKKYVKAVNRASGKLSVTMSNGDKLEMSQGRKDEILRHLIS